jgi:hypothetical protein
MMPVRTPAGQLREPGHHLLRFSPRIWNDALSGRTTRAGVIRREKNLPTTERTAASSHRERRRAVILAAAHRDHDPTNNRLGNLQSLCQRCHLTHDRAWHLLQRWITYRLRYARGDLFLGPYRHGRIALVLAEILARISGQVAYERGAAGRSHAAARSRVGLLRRLPDLRTSSLPYD